MNGPIDSIASNLEEHAHELSSIKTQFKEFKEKVSTFPSEIKEMSHQFLKRVDGSLKHMSIYKTNLETGSKLLQFYVQDMFDLANFSSGRIVKNMQTININTVLLEIL